VAPNRIVAADAAHDADIVGHVEGVRDRQDGDRSFARAQVPDGLFVVPRADLSMSAENLI
jgi:hypothetical protein